jgi:hypothetical protein
MFCRIYIGPTRSKLEYFSMCLPYFACICQYPITISSTCQVFRHQTPRGPDPLIIAKFVFQSGVMHSPKNIWQWHFTIAYGTLSNVKDSDTKQFRMRSRSGLGSNWPPALRVEPMARREYSKNGPKRFNDYHHPFERGF